MSARAHARSRVVRPVLACAAWGALASVAHAGEYRRLTVDPGLNLDVEILATTGEGFEVQVPQGRLSLPFDQVWQLDELPGPEAVRATPWRVQLVADAEATRLLTAAWSGIDGLTLDVVDGATRKACGDRLDCYVDRLPVDGWRFVVVASTDKDGVHAAGALTGTARVARGDADRSPAAVASLARQLLGLLPEDDVPAALVAVLSPRDATPRERPPREPDAAPVARARPVPATPDAPAAPRARTTTGRRVGLAFVPFPGVPSLARGDWGGFALALGTTAATTAGWVGVTGTTSTSRDEWIGLSVAGAYVLSVASSELFAHVDLRRHRVAVTALPVLGPGGVSGATVGVTMMPVPAPR
ncbi:MAG: hypothetical protein H6733_10465 [Alphaproteobacteria bacterium]|nr:hypothetical protein [Alphaproteobacteria bacterium]